MNKNPGRVLACAGATSVFGAFLSLLIYSAAWSPSLRAQLSLVDSYEAEVLHDIQRELRRAFDDSRVAVAGCALAVAATLEVAPEKLEGIRPVLWGTLRGNDRFSSAGFQAESNASVSFVRTGGNYSEYRRLTPGSPTLTAFLVRDDRAAAVADPTSDITVPPLKNRAWYVGAVAQRGTVIISHYFSVLGAPVVTISTAVTDSSSALLGAVNVGLSVSSIARRPAATEDYDVYVVSGTNATLISSSRSQNATGEWTFARDSPDPLVSGSARRLREELEDGADHRGVITVDGRRYVAGVQRLDADFDVTAVVLLPWDRFFSRLERSKRLTVGTSIASIVMCVVVAIIIGACFFRIWSRERSHLAAAQHDASMHRKKQQLLASLSHEMRTPMAVVVGLLEEMQADSGGEAFEENLALLRKTAEDMMHLLDGILMLAKNEAGKSNVEAQVFKLRAELERALAGIGPLVSQKEVRTWLRYGDGLAEDVIGDRRKLRQVLDNLLSNAVKFTRSGEIGISARRTSDAPDGSSRVEISVSDTGCGIPHGMEEAMFREFVQAENVREVHGGTGLGLSIVRSLCRLMGGDVEVASTGPEGTTFRFWIRLRLAASFRAQDSIVSTLESQNPLKGLRILVAKDTRLISKLIERLLTKEGAEPTMTADGIELMDAYVAAPDEYSAILMDLQMPRLNGYDATRRIRAMEAAGSLPGKIPIIALTAHAMDSDAAECRRGSGFFRS
ncbi:hypothetical protein KFL_006520100 [Klebsormidium nitens]|uniref:histidine kinase n=1 Tax=Klebsormidium nitens TaxID=105231 RepID=A0A1Y1IIB0_KLENI|nr:hypothetical protein KFL_006520100 [Klebsormidium nitens]|eukprot:GAQ90534.1 hypothetical protein KFL_006520100 [Klebsormidium nitens]